MTAVESCTLSSDLGWALGVLSRFYVKAVAATFAEVPGGARGYQVLAAAARDEHGSQLALAQHLGVDRTVMTYLLDSLAEAEDRQAFRALLQRLALHAATTLDSAAPDPCSEPVPGSC